MVRVCTSNRPIYCSLCLQPHRDEWRIWADNEIKFLKEANKERVKIVNENRRLRAALSKPSDSKQEELLIQQDLELSQLSEMIAQAHLTKSTLEAELKVFESA